MPHDETYPLQVSFSNIVKHVIIKHVIIEYALIKHMSIEHIIVNYRTHYYHIRARIVIVSITLIITMIKKNIHYYQSMLLLFLSELLANIISMVEYVNIIIWVMTISAS